MARRLLAGAFEAGSRPKLPSCVLTVLLDKTDDPRIGIKGLPSSDLRWMLSGTGYQHHLRKRERMSEDVLEVISWDPDAVR